MLISCTSDLHGRLPYPAEIKGELLIIAGDLCGGGDAFSQTVWYEQKFLPWLDELYHIKHVFLTWGNHDWIGTHDLRMEDPRVTVLVDSGVHYKGYYFYGTPWQPPFYNWAFNAREEKLAQYFAQIPDYTDVLISHGPPRDAGDRVPGGRRVGSTALKARLMRNPIPYVICGHIHDAAGDYTLQSPYGISRVINVSYLNEAYQPTNPIVYLTLPEKETPDVPRLPHEISPSVLDNRPTEAA